MKTNQITKKNDNLVEGENVLMSEDITIFLADISGSMSDSFALSATSGQPTTRWGGFTKMAALKDALLAYINKRVKVNKETGSNDLFGVIAFGYSSDPDVRLLHDPHYSNYDSLLKKIHDLTSDGGTPMAEAVSLAVETSERCDGMVRIVIISDGQPDYRAQVLREVKNAFENYGLIFDTILIGSDARCVGFMKEVAELGGGEYSCIDDAEALMNKFLAIEEERALLMGNGILMLPQAGTDV